MIYGNSGLDGVREQINTLRQRGLIYQAATRSTVITEALNGFVGKHQ